MNQGKVKISWLTKKVILTERQFQDFLLQLENEKYLELILEFQQKGILKFYSTYMEEKPNVKVYITCERI